MNEGFDEIFEKMEQGYLLVEPSKYPNPSVVTNEADSDLQIKIRCINTSPTKSVKRLLTSEYSG